MPVATDPVVRFVAHLEDLVREDDRAALAALRRGLGKGVGIVPEVHPHVVPWLPDGAAPSREDAYYLVAMLFALWHQGETTPMAATGSLGRSLRVMADQDLLGRESLERRFVGLLSAPREDLPDHLRHAVSLLRARRVLVNWAQLLRDLPRWERLDRSVQRRWARDFWARPTSRTAETLAPPEAGTPTGTTPRAGGSTDVP